MRKNRYEYSEMSDSMESAHVRNRKRSLRWYSEETALIQKYGATSNRYIDLYITDPDQIFD